MKSKKKVILKISLSFFSLFFVSLINAQKAPFNDSTETKHLFFKKQLNINYALLKTGYKLSKPFAPNRVSKRRTKLTKKGYQLMWEDQFDSFNSKLWRKGQMWGVYNPGTPHQYHDDESIIIKNGILELWAQYKPKLIRTKDDSIVIPYALGLINSDIGYFAKYGYFEARCKMPKAPASWPAFWLTGRYSWPPEIDIFESYGGASGKSVVKQSQSVHWGRNNTGTHEFIARKVKVMRNKDTGFHVYACEWSPRSIKFYTDGKLIRTTKLNKFMAYSMNQELCIVLNIGIEAKYLPKELSSFKRNALLVDWVRVYQLKRFDK
jgi:beta-glucanase (GH16 family)